MGINMYPSTALFGHGTCIGTIDQFLIEIDEGELIECANGFGSNIKNSIKVTSIFWILVEYNYSTKYFEIRHFYIYT